MATILIRNGTLVDPTQNISDLCDILIEDGIVIKVEPFITVGVDRVIEAKNLMVFPGIVDMHVHLRDPGQIQKEDIFSGTNCALAGGVTSMLCMPNTNPVIDNEKTATYIKETALKARAKIYMCGAMTNSLEGKTLANYEGYKKWGIIAVSDDGRPVSDTDTMLQAMLKAEKNELVAISHCEDLDIVAKGIINKGEVSEKLMVRGIDRESENSVTKREIDLAKANNTRIHIAHMSTKEVVQYVREAKAEGVKVTCETCPHYFAYTEQKLLSRDADYRMNPPLREQADVDAIIEGIKDGTIDCITTDHAPHTKKEKQDFLTAPNGVTGMETSLSAGMRFLVEPKHITISRLIELMSTNPARILGIDGGSLKVGSKADVALFDPHIQWTVLPERLNTKAKSSIFKFERLQGRVKYTFVDGELAYVMRY